MSSQQSPNDNSNAPPLTYMNIVPGLQGWNDPPPVAFNPSASSKSKRISSAQRHQLASTNSSTSQASPSLTPPMPPLPSFSQLQTTNSPPAVRKEEKREIPGEAKELIHTKFTQLLVAIEQKASSGMQKKILEDSNKRLQQLFKDLNENVIPSSLISKLQNLLPLVDAADYQQAAGETVKLMTTVDGQFQSWILGIKRLLELAQQVL